MSKKPAKMLRICNWRDRPKTLKAFKWYDKLLAKAIDKGCFLLHAMPPFILKLKVEVIQDGVVTAVYEDYARSWVRNYYNFITMQTLGVSFGVAGTTYGAGYLVMKRTNGTNDFNTIYLAGQRSPMDNSTGHFRAGAGVATSGIVVGTGTTAESFEHSAIATPVAHGNGAGQLSYTAMASPAVIWSGATKKFTETIERYINNNGGGSITVNEVALYCNIHSTSTPQDYLLARDLLSPAVAVPDTAQLKVTYTIESATYPV